MAAYKFGAAVETLKQADQGLNQPGSNAEVRAALARAREQEEEQRRRQEVERRRQEEEQRRRQAEARRLEAARLRRQGLGLPPTATDTECKAAERRRQGLGLPLTATDAACEAEEARRKEEYERRVAPRGRCADCNEPMPADFSGRGESSRECPKWVRE
jgi:hypothetical protein